MRRCFHCRALVAALGLAIAGSGPTYAAADARLIQAVKSGDAQAVRAALSQGVDVNAPQGDGTTALHWAARLNDVAVADLLLRSGARAGAANDNGATPLHLACLNRSAALVDRLLAAGADPNAAMPNGETVLMTCARAGSAAAVKSLLVRGANVNVAEKSHGQTALMWAVAQGHPDVAKTLVEARADVRARSRVYPVNVVGEDTQRAGREELTYTVLTGGLTPLLFTARSGDAESARVLLDAGADANDRLADGTSALTFAAFNGRTDVGKLLLAGGANPNDLGAGFTPLHAAILRSDVTLVRALLDRGANPNLRMTKGTPKRRDSEDFNLQAPLIGTTPYLLAAKFIEPEILRVLKAAGADITVTLPNGANALMLAAGLGSIRTANRRNVRTVDFGKMEPETQALAAVEAVVSFGTDVNAANQTGDTALHAAAAMGYDTVIQFLAGHGAQINVKNKRGLTPLGALISGGRGGRGRVDANGDSYEDSSNASTIALLRKLGGTE